MRFIPTTTAKVESLRKQAKALQRNGGGKHAELLDRVARSAGYEHWHHVKLCHRESMGIREDRSLGRTIAQIVQAECEGKIVIIGTGTDTSTSQPFLLFSSGIGDAWLLDPIEDRCCCLVWRRQPQTPHVRDLPKQLEIMWDGNYEFRGEFFEVRTSIPHIGHRAIAGYPVEELREFLLHAQPADKSIEQLFGRDNSLPLTDDVIEQLVRSGWEQDRLVFLARQGAKYSPSRNTIIFPSLTQPDLIA